jgi:DNA replication licensing factor MCM2
MGGEQGEEEEGDGENLFGDEMENDYRANPELDRFDPALLDEEEYEALSEGEHG